MRDMKRYWPLVVMATALALLLRRLLSEQTQDFLSALSAQYHTICQDILVGCPQRGLLELRPLSEELIF